MTTLKLHCDYTVGAWALEATGGSGFPPDDFAWCALRQLSDALQHAEPVDNKRAVVPISVDAARYLGTVLARIADGEDGRQVFRQQRRRGGQDHFHRHSSIAIRYWTLRAEGRLPKAAAQSVHDSLPVSDRVSPATIRRYARKHREQALMLLENTSTDLRRDIPALRRALEAAARTGMYPD